MRGELSVGIRPIVLQQITNRPYNFDALCSASYLLQHDP